MLSRTVFRNYWSARAQSNNGGQGRGEGREEKEYSVRLFNLFTKKRIESIPTNPTRPVLVFDFDRLRPQCRRETIKHGETWMKKSVRANSIDSIYSDRICFSFPLCGTQRSVHGEEKRTNSIYSFDLVHYQTTHTKLWTLLIYLSRLEVRELFKYSFVYRFFSTLNMVLELTISCQQDY